MGVGGRQRRVKESRTRTGWCPPASPTRLSRRELALARFARFGPPGWLENLKKAFKKNDKKVPKKGTKKSTQPHKKLKFCMNIWKSSYLRAFKKMDKKVPKKGTKKSTQPRKNSEVLHEKLKIVLPMGILKKKKLKNYPDPQLSQTFKPIGKFFGKFFTHIVI